MFMLPVRDFSLDAGPNFLSNDTYMDIRSANSTNVEVKVFVMAKLFVLYGVVNA